jgi:hypothetical protein
LDNIDRIKFVREASHVARCHTQLCLNRPNIGHHSFNMLGILRVLYPEAPIALVWAILEHDLPERLTGDIPSPSKAHGAVSQGDLQLLEENILNRYVSNDSIQDLSDADRAWLHGLDLIELYCWCKDEESLGNRRLRPFKGRLEAASRKMDMPIDLQHLFERIVVDDWEVIPELGEV